MTHPCTEGLSLPTLLEPARYYGNSASSIHTKLLKRHGYAEPEYNPLRTQPHKQRGKQLRQLNKDRVGMKVAAANEYRISPEELQRLNTAVFDETDPAKALQLGTFVSMIGNLLLCPSQDCKMTRNSLFVSKGFETSASFGPVDLINVVSRGQNKTGSTQEEHLFLMHQFDPAAFNPAWWLSAQDVYLNDVRLSQQPYTAQDGPFSGQQAHSFVEMAAKGMTDANLPLYNSLTTRRSGLPGLLERHESLYDSLTFLTEGGSTSVVDIRFLYLSTPSSVLRSTVSAVSTLSQGAFSSILNQSINTF